MISTVEMMRRVVKGKRLNLRMDAQIILSRIAALTVPIIARSVQENSLMTMVSPKKRSRRRCVIILSTRIALLKSGGNSTQMARGMVLGGSDLAPAAPSAKSRFPCGTLIIMHVSSIKGFWTQRIENALKELGSADVGRVSGKLLRSKLKEDRQLTKKQKKMISINRESGFYTCLKEGGRVNYNHAGAIFAGFLFSRGKWEYDSNDDTVWLWEWGFQTQSSRCAYCCHQRPGLTVCADCKDSSEAPMYCSEKCQKSDKRSHSDNCGVFQIMKLGQEQGCTGEELLKRLRERSR
mmetsp:Transcript_17001/g.27903  ORF Transcript_17001/g.27903 Transcript_17001/m.27903 type:complete len:293 (+) Transcript_17001:437-1315(+)